MKIRHLTVAALCWICGSTLLEAQFNQYTPPGTFVGRTTTLADTIDRAMKEARWRSGRFYWDPWAALRNLNYTDQSEREGSQLTATVGIGIRGYTPVASEMTLALHLLPEYVWWQDESERNRWNGRYGLGLFGDLGRTGMELSATRKEDAVFFSQELEQQVNTRLDEIGANFDFNVGGGFSVIAGGTLRAIRYLDEPGEIVNLSVVDRDEQFYRLLVGLPMGRGFELALGAEYSQAEFDPGLSDRSNSGISPVLTAEYSTPDLLFAARLFYLQLEPDGNGSQFVDYSGLAGSAELSWRALSRFEPQIYLRNNLVYSFTDIFAYYDSPTAGLALKVALARWSWIRAFGELGVNDYVPFEGLEIERQDDFNSWGADIGFRFGKGRLSFGAWRTKYDSNLPIFDRTTSGVRANFGIGTGGGPWG